VASNAVAIATELGLSSEEVERIRWASLLHDIGKIATPEAILRKPGPLTSEERSVVSRHPERGAGILREMAPFRPLADYVHYHQEAYDGTGYPEGLAGEAIPLGARIVRVADTFDAMISYRPYRRRRTVDEAMSELPGMAGAALDPTLVEVFLRVLKEKPPFDVQLQMWRER
jgi:putative nucleotidyltransferase with HDIG domain